MACQQGIRDIIKSCNGWTFYENYQTDVDIENIIVYNIGERKLRVAARKSCTVLRQVKC